MEQLSATDNSFLVLESTRAPQHIGALSIYDPSTAPGKFVRFKDLLALFEANLHKSPVFRRKLVTVPLELDRGFWIEDPHFDLEFHVRHVALPKPGDWRQLCIQVARLHARSLDRNRPLWEAYIIEGLDSVKDVPKGSFAMYLKLHHAVADGMGSLGVFGALHTLEADTVTPEPDLDRTGIRKEPSSGEVIIEVYRQWLRRPFRTLRAARKAIPKLFQSASLKDYGVGEYGRGKTPFDGPVSAHRVFDATSVELSHIKAMRAMVAGSTVNDVACAIIALALRTYLKKIDSLPDEPIVACVPVSMRGQAEAIDRAGNDIEVINIPLPTNLEEPMEVLAEIRAITEANKAFREAHGASALLEFSKEMPALMQGFASRAAALSVRLGGSGHLGASMTVTNVPGPPVPLYLGGAKCVTTYALGLPTDGAGLFNIISSYAGQLILSFTACRDQLPDPECYKLCLDGAIEAMRESSGPYGSVVAGKAKRPVAKKTKAVRKSRSRRVASNRKS